MVDVHEHHGTVEVWTAIALILGHAPEMVAEPGGAAAWHRVVAELVRAPQSPCILALESVAERAVHAHARSREATEQHAHAHVVALD